MQALQRLRPLGIRNADHRAEQRLSTAGIGGPVEETCQRIHQPECVCPGARSGVELRRVA